MSETTNETCFVCSKRPADSREHLPAKAAGNLGAVEVFYLESSVGPDDTTQYRSKVFDDGFWVKRLCEDCNHRIGTRYVVAYQRLMQAIGTAAGIRALDGRLLISLKDAYPARILKQMFAMFLAALPRHPSPELRPLQDFVRLRDSVLPVNAPDVYLYHNSSSVGRIVPCCGFMELMSDEKLLISEISWPPLGMIFSYQPSRRLKAMEQVSSWGRFGFKQRSTIQLSLPSLEVSTPFPLVYGERAAAERERNERGHTYLVQAPTTPGGKIDVAAQLRRLA